MDSSPSSPINKNTIDALWRLEKVILDTLDFKDLVQKIVDSMLTELGYLNLGYKIIVLALINKEKNLLERISISQTDEARRALSVMSVPFHDVKIPLNASNNFCIQAVNTNSPQTTHQWIDLLTPMYTQEEAKYIQELAGIKTSLIYPVTYHNSPQGVMIFSLNKEEEEVTVEERDLIRSLTDIVGIAVQNAKLYTQMDQLSKLKDEFVYLASHELRTPLTAIKSYNWMILNGKTEPVGPTTRKYLDIIYSSTERLINLVSEMLDLSRIESGKVVLKQEQVNVNDLLTNVKQEFAARAVEKQLTLETECDKDIAVNADKDKLLQILENLVGNSFKFTPPNGRVKVVCKKADKFLSFDVTDTGKGIAEEDIPKLFAKFWRNDNSLVVNPESGTGLGLYITKQFVELHGGQISASSKLGEGTTFTFTIPLA